jgi:hypothetical protein
MIFGGDLVACLRCLIFSCYKEDVMEEINNLKSENGVVAAEDVCRGCRILDAE